MSTFLLLTSMAGCGGTEVITETKYVDREVPVRVKVPEGMLQPCPVAPLPQPGDTWQDAWISANEKDKEQHSCNDRFEQIRQWQNGEDDGDT